MSHYRLSVVDLTVSSWVILQQGHTKYPKSTSVKVQIFNIRNSHTNAIFGYRFLFIQVMFLSGPRSEFLDHFLRSKIWSKKTFNDFESPPPPLRIGQSDLTTLKIMVIRFINHTALCPKLVVHFVIRTCIH